jgi:hypothetical protein
VRIFSEHSATKDAAALAQGHVWITMAIRELHLSTAASCALAGALIWHVSHTLASLLMHASAPQT